jgi:hydroxymethylpyrimidine pyrophosphatase-like HAD family hydrolase
MSPSRVRSDHRRTRHIRFDRPVSPLAAFASDLDRTLVNVGDRPSGDARAALREAQALGLGTLLVSGRRYPDLMPYVRALRYVDGLVAENGAIVEAPLGSVPRVFGRAVGAAVRVRLAAVPGLEVEYGEVVASVLQRHAPQLRRAVKGLPVQLVGNVRHLMALPTGISKGSGTRRALVRLGYRAGRYAAIGDAENDLDLLSGAALAGAVANAEPEVRAAADYVCRGRYAAGVLEFIRGPVTERVRATAD